MGTCDVLCPQKEDSHTPAWQQIGKDLPPPPWWPIVLLTNQHASPPRCSCRCYLGCPGLHGLHFCFRSPPGSWDRQRFPIIGDSTAIACDPPILSHDPRGSRRDGRKMIILGMMARSSRAFLIYRFTDTQIWMKRIGVNHDWPAKRFSV
jgi:hypothetical protein